MRTRWNQQHHRCRPPPAPPPLCNFFVRHDSGADKLLRAQILMQTAMKRLQKEFYQILASNRDCLDPESVSTRSSRTSARSSTSDFDYDTTSDDEIRVVTDSISEVERVSSLATADLKAIVHCMIHRLTNPWDLRAASLLSSTRLSPPSPIMARARAPSWLLNNCTKEDSVLLARKWKIVMKQVVEIERYAVKRGLALETEDHAAQGCVAAGKGSEEEVNSHLSKEKPHGGLGSAAEAKGSEEDLTKKTPCAVSHSLSPPPPIMAGTRAPSWLLHNCTKKESDLLEKKWEKVMRHVVEIERYAVKRGLAQRCAAAGKGSEEEEVNSHHLSKEKPHGGLGSAAAAKGIKRRPHTK